MASLAMAAVGEAAKQLPLHEAISGIFGSISMAAWICVIVCAALAEFWRQRASLTPTTTTAPSDDCQLPSEERRRAEHILSRRLDDWRCYELGRCVFFMILR